MKPQRKNLTPLRAKMTDELTVRGLSKNTQLSYLGSVERLARFYRRSPDQITEDEVKDFLLHLIRNCNVSLRSANVIRCGIRFFFHHVLGLTKEDFIIPGSKQATRLPAIPSREQVMCIIEATGNLKYRALLMLAYSAGLRVSEIVNLQATDINSKDMTIRIQQGKGSKDRYSVLSEQMLTTLRQYWRDYQPYPWLFPGLIPDRPLTTSSVQRVFTQARTRAGITERYSIHSLRHAFCHASH